LKLFVILSFICLLILGVGAFQYVPSSYTANGTLSLNPGWQFVQDFTPANCSGTTCVMPSTCTTVNCIAPPTVGDVVVVAMFMSGSTTAVISGISGSTGTTWTNCGSGCHSAQAANTTIDVEYTLAIQATTQGLTVTCSVAGCANGAFLDVQEWRPPSGKTAIFDDGEQHQTASCTTCTGATLTVTGTDFIIQYPAGAVAPVNLPWSSPYSGTLQAMGICTNCTSGTAPTFTAASATIMNIVGIAFKTSAGVFTPPTPTFSIANYSQPTLSTAANCSPSCSITIASTGSGHLLFVTEWDTNSGSPTLAISGFTSPGGCHEGGATGGLTLNCAYLLSSTASVTSLSVTMSSNTSVAYFAVWEISRISGSFSLDTVGCTLNAGNANFLPPGEALTLANTNPHVTFQMIVASGGVDGATFYPLPFANTSGNGTVITNANTSGSNAVLLNDTVGQTPAWPFPGTTTTTTTDVCGASFQ
jgi:hypothetical protein